MNRISTLGVSVVVAAVLAACGGGGGDGGSSASTGASGSTGSSGSGTSGSSGSSGASGSTTSFPFTRYDVYALYDTSTHLPAATLASVSATQASVAIGSWSYRGALGGGETTVTLGTDGVSLKSGIVAAGDLSWLAPGADGQLIQQCSVVRQDAAGASVGGYPKAMMVMVAGTATALAKVTDIPAGTRLYAADDCQFTGSAPTGDIAKVSPQTNDSAVVNADGSVTVALVGAGAGSLTLSAANLSAALAAGGTGLDVVGQTPVPSTTGKANGSYAVHAYSLPRTGAAARYVIVIQATPTGGMPTKGVVSMLVSA